MESYPSKPLVVLPTYFERLPSNFERHSNLVSIVMTPGLPASPGVLPPRTIGIPPHDATE